MLDFAFKVAEYRELTDALVPAKFWRDWVNMFKAGKPFYPSEEHVEKLQLKEIEKVFNIDTAVLDDETLALLDQCDFDEYKDMVGEWEATVGDVSVVPPPAGVAAVAAGLGGKLTHNRIVGHIVNRLHEICYPDKPGAPRPIFPVFPFKGILLGRPFAGKSSCLKLISQSMNPNQ